MGLGDGDIDVAERVEAGHGVDWGGRRAQRRREEKGEEIQEEGEERRGGETD